MRLNAKNCIRILNVNFGFKIKKDKDFGECILMPLMKPIS